MSGKDARFMEAYDKVGEAVEEFFDSKDNEVLPSRNREIPEKWRKLLKLKEYFD
ncbi:hypothetical protein KIN20_033394 [Parelaphostrongylus tenuis]|uniref:Uncharacterized protein n=1 Tax=Parelaphostrongylus tenuis TaxID=148309 RepID=A0AAD5R8L5_PARTN|nr:hypothetical protein KIN20_033394 [Parelaphostrongylus tenuis]